VKGHSGLVSEHRVIFTGVIFKFCPTLNYSCHSTGTYVVGGFLSLCCVNLNTRVVHEN
jgi:hypothetical protein